MIAMETGLIGLRRKKQEGEGSHRLHPYQRQEEVRNKDPDCFEKQMLQKMSWEVTVFYFQLFVSLPTTSWTTL